MISAREVRLDSLALWRLRLGRKITIKLKLICMVGSTLSIIMPILPLQKKAYIMTELVTENGRIAIEF